MAITYFRLQNLYQEDQDAPTDEIVRIDTNSLFGVSLINGITIKFITSFEHSYTFNDPESAKSAYMEIVEFLEGGNFESPGK